MVQDLATQWIQPYPCKTKTSQDGEKFVEILGPAHKPKIVHTDHSLEFGNHVKIYHGIIGPQDLIDPRQNGIPEREVRRVKEGTSSVLLQSGLDERWWSGSMECWCFSAKRPRPPGRWEDSV